MKGCGGLEAAVQMSIIKYVIWTPDQKYAKYEIIIMKGMGSS